MDLRKLQHALVALIALMALASSAASSRGQSTKAVTTSANSGLSAQMFNYQPNGNLIKAPTNRPVSRRSGLSLLIDTRWPNNYGYRPIAITVSSPTPVATDRTILFRLHVKSWAWNQGSIQIEQEFDLPKGASTATATLSVPQYFGLHAGNGQQSTWEVFVNGVLDRDLSYDPRSSGASVSIAANPEAGLSILAVGTPQQTKQSLFANSLEYEIFFLDLPDLPRRWIDYTSFDVISLSVPELNKLGSSNPKALAAIRQWAAAGGQLWITGAGSSWEQLASIERDFTLNPRTAADGEVAGPITDEQAMKRGWGPQVIAPTDGTGRVVTFRDYSTNTQRVVRDPKTIDRLQRSGQFQLISDTTNSGPTREEVNSTKWFLDHPIGLGTVRAFRGPAIHDAWSKAAQTIGQTQPAGVPPNASIIGTGPQQGATAATPTDVELFTALESVNDWQTRHGLLPDEPNPEFGDWLVLGVGLAPVTAFRVLITLFVLLIGPVNYWLLKRFHRLHLLVVTVPVAALLLTGALFIYALISDGLHTTVRARSFTLLHAASGEAATWTRLSYYAGVAPGQGLLMPAESAIYPIVPADYSGDAASELRTDREMIWDENQARLTRGWLRSRRPTQYLTVHVSKSEARLQLAPGENRMRAKNDLGADIEFVTVVDQAGNLFTGENIAQGATVELAATDLASVRNKWRTFNLDHAPAPPAELADISRANQWSINSGVRYIGRYPNSQTSSLSENTLSLSIRRWTDFDDDPLPAWRKRTFVALTTTNPQVTSGLENVREEGSFHITAGHW